MSRSVYSWLASGLFLGAILVLGVIMTTSQQSADTLSYVAVVSGLTLSIGSFLAFIGIELRHLIGRKLPTRRSATQAIRQGIEIALFAIGWALLRIYTNLNTWETILLCTALISAEIAFSLRRNVVEGDL
jgi:hypothetical protein